jgi:amino acid adenylation domain-containing protein
MTSQLVQYPASAIQNQFWLINQIQPNNSTYNIPSLFHVQGHLDINALQQGIENIARRHEILRSTFLSENGRLLQVVNENIDLTIQIRFDIDEMPGFDDQERKKEIRDRIISDICQPFDLENGPLLKIKLYKHSADYCCLLFVIHHIITDLRSNDILFAELSSLYNAIAGDGTVSLDKSLSQYREYSSWQHAFLSSEQYRSSLSFWMDELAGKELYLNLPTDKQRPIIQELQGTAIPFNLSIESSYMLRQYCRQNNFSLYLVTLTAYLILLYRYSGQTEIIIGIPFSNRRHENHKNTIGCFVNILPITFVISPSKNRFADVLQQVRGAMLKGHRNQEVPYNLLVKEVKPLRDPSYNPIFQVGFTFEPPMELTLHGLSLESEKIHNHGAHLDLFAILWEHDGNLHGMFEYNTGLFAKETVQRITSHFKELLSDVIHNPQLPIDQLSILPADERNLLVEQWNTTKIPFQETLCLQQLFEKQAQKTPDSIACSFANRQLSYKELDEKAGKLAHHLRSKKVGPGTLVGIFLERSLDMLIALLGVLKAGGAYVPLDPDFPKDRIGYMVENANVAVLITTSDQSSQLPEHKAQVVFVDIDWLKINNCLADHFDSGATADDLAYLIYTSGSTGHPKGVKVHHRAVVNFLTSMGQSPGFSAQDVLLAVTTLSFDISVLELFLPISVGGKVVIAPRESIADGHQLLDMITDHQITVMQATPTTWHLLIAAGWDKKDNFKALCGGEPMPSDLAGELLQRASSVWNLYGPTETTVWSTCHRINRHDSTVLVGRPIANTQTYIVDQYGQTTPIGVAGELLIGGEGVTKGYLHRPNLTTEKFTPDTFTNVPGQKLYHTGDIATYLADGTIKLYGRIDQQIKLRGYRIELGEIESALLSCHGIAQAAVIVKNFGQGDQRLVAYFTTDGIDSSPVDCRAALQAKLPRYMVPSFFEQLEQMPLTANGKIDRAKLPTPAQQQQDIRQIHLEAANNTEKILIAIWLDVLEIQRVGVHDNFFDLGGNSLLSLQVLVEIEKNLHIKVPTVKFFQYPTVLSLANYLTESNDYKTVAVVEKQAKLQRKALQYHLKRSLRKKV